MRHSRSYCAAILAVALTTPFAFAQNNLSITPERLHRTTPVTEAVKKTMPNVVAIRIPRKGERDMVGSGIIFDRKNGLLVTNRHVIADRTSVNVSLHDGAILVGQVVATEPDLDLAIVQIHVDYNKHKLTELKFTSGDLMIGEDVIAIGSPYGYDATVSRGILSAVNREIKMPNDVLMSGLIQHDAAINPGNSGGPLVNVNADVIGINVAMRDGAQNIAFAINAATVNGFIEKFYQRKSSVMHGIKYEEKIVAEVGDRQRVVIKNAAHAELKSGDEIRTIGDMQVANPFDVERAFCSKKPGQKVEVKVNRQGREVTMMLTFAASQGAGSVAAVSPQNSAANHADTSNVRSANEQ